MIRFLIGLILAMGIGGQTELVLIALQGTVALTLMLWPVWDGTLDER